MSSAMPFGVTPFQPSPNTILLNAGDPVAQLPLVAGPGGRVGTYRSYRCFFFGSGTGTIGQFAFGSTPAEVSGRQTASGAGSGNGTPNTAFGYSGVTTSLGDQRAVEDASGLASLYPSGQALTISGSSSGSGGSGGASSGTGFASGAQPGVGIPFANPGPGFRMPVIAGFIENLWLREGSYVQLIGSGISVFITAGDGL